MWLSLILPRILVLRLPPPTDSSTTAPWEAICFSSIYDRPNVQSSGHFVSQNSMKQQIYRQNNTAYCGSGDCQKNNWLQQDPFTGKSPKIDLKKTPACHIASTGLQQLIILWKQWKEIDKYNTKLLWNVAGMAHTNRAEFSALVSQPFISLINKEPHTGNEWNSHKPGNGRHFLAPAIISL